MDLELRTPRLLLREVVPADADDIHAYAGDPVVCEHVAWGPNASLEETRRVMAIWEVERTAEPRTTWTLALQLDDSVIGAISITTVNRHTAEFGYTLRRSHWGRGYTTEAARAVLDWAFTVRGFHRVTATCRPENVGSARVLEKAGLRLEGRMRDHLWIRGGYRDSLLYAALRTDDRTEGSLTGG